MHVVYVYGRMSYFMHQVGAITVGVIPESYMNFRYTFFCNAENGKHVYTVAKIKYIKGSVSFYNAVMS